MKRITLIAASAFGLAIATPVAASDWNDVKDPAELRALYVNKTHYRKSYSGEATRTHYRADGKALFVSGERRIPRTWEVRGNDQVCWKDDALGLHCGRVQRSMKNPNEIVVIEVGGNYGFVGGLVRIEDGIPQF